MRGPNYKHGEGNPGEHTAEYDIWRSMRQRCSDVGCPRYEQYGARGIRVCERWNDYANFIADMGRRPPEKASIDRIDNSGDYTPENCRWATAKEQANNRSSNKIVEFNGERMTVSQWSSKIGIGYSALVKRLSKGWSPQKALTTPKRYS